MSTLTLSYKTAVIICLPLGAHSIPTVQYDLVLPNSSQLSRHQMSNSPAKLPKPPISAALENGSILIVFLYLFPNSNNGLLSLSYNVATAGYVPDITMK